MHFEIDVHVDGLGSRQQVRWTAPASGGATAEDTSQSQSASRSQRAKLMAKSSDGHHSGYVAYAQRVQFIEEKAKEGNCLIYGATGQRASN